MITGAKPTISLSDVLERAIAAAAREQGPGAIVGSEHVIGPLLSKQSDALSETLRELSITDADGLSTFVKEALDRLPDITIDVDVPVAGDIAFASVARGMPPTNLAAHVLREARLDPDNIPPVDNSDGYYIADHADAKLPVILVVTKDMAKPASNNLLFHLINAVQKMAPIRKGAVIWMPLMGTDADDLTPLSSLVSMIGALREGGLFDKMNGGKIIFSVGRDQADALPELQAYLRGIFPSFKDAEAIAEQQRALMAQELRNDQPSAVDHFGHEPLVRALTEFMSAPGTKPPLVIGIDAPWGAGKSSIMKMLQNRLQPAAETAEDTQRRDAAKKLTWKDVESLKQKATAQDEEQKQEQEEEPAEPDAPRRVFETVYFNAWRHGDGERLTASLVNTVIQSIIAKRSLSDESFWLRLNLKRIDLGALKQELFSKFIAASVNRLIGLGILTLIALFGLIGFAWNYWVGGGSLAAAALGFVGFFMKARADYEESPVDVSVERYFRVPDYNALMGPLAEIEEDFRLVLDALKDEDRRENKETVLVIFIDDLDRCGPSATAKIVETINVFFGQETENCMFVLGMHKHMVAASLELAYEKLTQHAKNDPALAEELPFGRRFLEKIVQFHVRIPDPDDRDVERYLSYLTGARPADALSFEEQTKIREAVAAKGKPPTTYDESLQYVEDLLDDVTPQDIDRDKLDTEEQARFDAKVEARREHAEGEIRLQNAIRFDEKDPKILEVFQTVQFALRRNPRQYVRFLNALRFANFLDSFDHRDRSGSAAEQILDLAKREVLALEWPDLYRDLITQNTNVDEFLVSFDKWYAVKDSLRETIAEAIGVDPAIWDMTPDTLDKDPASKKLRDRLEKLASDQLLADLAAVRLDID